jgi:hypothetical protein
LLVEPQLLTSMQSNTAHAQRTFHEPRETARFVIDGL